MRILQCKLTTIEALPLRMERKSVGLGYRI